jgi:pimeloyl-ACP methyl ester carboxylesterase
MARTTIVMASDGTDVAVHALGGRGRPAVLVHAAGFLAEALRPLAHELGGFFNCWGPDLRGHGESSVPADLDFSWGGFALDVLAAVDVARGALARREPGGRPSPPVPTDPQELNRQLVGIGHSVGATALLAAEASHPGTFAALYCFEPIVVLPDDRRPPGAPNPLADSARRRRAIFSSRAAAGERYRSRGTLAKLDPAVLATYLDRGFVDLADGSVALRCRPEHEALVYEHGLACETFDVLDQVHCPVTVAVGTGSVDLGRAAAPAVVAALADARLVEVEGVGHLGPLESPPAVAASILSSIGMAAH